MDPIRVVRVVGEKQKLLDLLNCEESPALWAGMNSPTQAGLNVQLSKLGVILFFVF